MRTQCVENTRTLAQRALAMRQRRLRDGTMVNFTFEHLFEMPHFEFFSHEISSTGYRSDFFGGIGRRLSESEVLEAFDVRANEHRETHKKELKRRAREAEIERKRRRRDEIARETIQLPLDF